MEDRACPHGHHVCRRCEAEALVEKLVQQPLHNQRSRNMAAPVRVSSASRPRFVGRIPVRQDVACGKAGQILVTTATGWEWQDPPAARAQ